MQERIQKSIIKDRMKKITVLLLIYITVFCGNVKTLAQEKPVYDVKDKFKMVEGIPIPKLSSDKMVLEDNVEYKTLLDINKEIYINTSSDSIHKTLFFYDEKKPHEIIENYNLKINKPLKCDFNLQIKYTVRIKYFTNGKIRSYEVYLTDIGTLKNFMDVGLWYYFDESGKTIKKVDHEKKYRNSLKDIFKIYENLTEENFFLKEMDDSFLYKVGQIINRFTNNVGECYWIINLPYYSVIINDKTRKIIDRVPNNEREKYLSKYDKNPKTEKKTGYNVKDDFDVIDGIPMPKLSKNKMFFKNNKKYQKFYKKNTDNDSSIIKINTQYDTINKELYFNSHRLVQIKEKYTLNILSSQQFSTCNCAGYNVTIDYYSNGNIKSYSIYLHYLDQVFFEIPVGVWYKFDEKGKILKKVDIDQMYKTTYSDILKLTHKTIVESKFGDAIDISKVTRFVNDDGNAYWIITYVHQYSEIIDDKTGSVIERSEDRDSSNNLYKRYERNSFEYKLYNEFFDND